MEREGFDLPPSLWISPFLDNNKLYVAGGTISFNRDRISPQCDPAPVEVYDEVRNRWSVVEQKHIPQTTLVQWRLMRRVFSSSTILQLILALESYRGRYTTFLYRNGKRVHALGIGRISENAVLCYLPVKKESLTGKATE